MPYSDRMKPPYECCGAKTRSTGHAHWICGQCGKKYDLIGRDMAEEMRGVDIDAIHYKRAKGK